MTNKFTVEINFFTEDLIIPPPKLCEYLYQNKSAKWHCGRHTLICKKILIKKK